MISRTTRSANSRTLFSSSSFTSSRTPSRDPISIRYSISSPVTVGPLVALPPKKPTSRLDARVTATESGQSSKPRTRTTGIERSEIRTGWRFPTVFGTISPRKRTTPVVTAIATAKTLAAFQAGWAAMRSAAMEPASAPAPTATSVLTMRRVDRTRSGCSIQIESIRARRPPPSCSRRARASPSAVSAVSVPEQNADPSRNPTERIHFHVSTAANARLSSLPETKKPTPLRAGERGFYREMGRRQIPDGASAQNLPSLRILDYRLSFQP